MKRNSKKVILSTRTRLILAASLVACGAAIWGICVGIATLHQLNLARCVIKMADEEVEIHAGKIIPARIIANHFGLTNGANLATIPFEALRKRMLDDMPNIRSVTIRRTLPNHVYIEVTERTPLVRVVAKPEGGSSTMAADRDGVVFWYPRNRTVLLPIVRERERTKTGKTLQGTAAAALRLIQEAANHPELQIQEACEEKSRNYITAVLGDSSRVKIAWADMLHDSKESRQSLTRQLARLKQAIASRVAEGTRNWNVTEWGDSARLYAKDPAKAD